MNISDLQIYLTKLINRNITQVEIAKALEKTKANISLRIKNKSELTESEIRKIESFFNISVSEEVSNSKFNDDIIEIDHIHINPKCGVGTEVYTTPYIEPFRISRSSITTYLKCTAPENLKMFQASGDSMSSIIEDGDMLLVDIGRKDPSISGIYIFTANDLYKCKRLNMTLDGRLEVKSDNKKYSDEIIGPDSGIEIKIIGRVLNNLSKLL